MKENKELNQQIRNTSVDKNGNPTIDIDERKSIYKSISEALKAIPITNRNVGLTISIYNRTKIVEYWWEKGIKDSDLVKKINTDDIPRIDAKLIDLQNQIDGINNIEFKVFDSLPEIGESSIIYVIPNAVGEEDDDFIEYFWIKSQQRYERFGGLNVDGGVTINNFYTFDNNIFTVTEESNIKNISLNSKKIIINSNDISIYKYDIGEENNKIQLYIGNYDRHLSNAVENGGYISLNGTFRSRNVGSKDFELNLYPNYLNIVCTENEIINKASLIPQNLTIEQGVNKSIITSDGIYNIKDEENVFEINETKLYANTDEIKLYSSIGFDINYYDNYGIKGFLDNDVKQVLLYALDNNIVITNNNIGLNIAGDSYINLNYDTFNAKFNTLIYLNAPITKVKKVLFEQNDNINIYLESYHNTSYGNSGYGLKSSSNIYLFDASYNILEHNENQFVSYGLNGIKYRISSDITGPVDYIISWRTVNSYPILNIGKDNDINIEGNKITIEKTNCSIRLDNDNNLIYLYNSNNGIIINSNDIKFRFGSSIITITSNGISDGTNTKTWTQLLS